MPYRVVVETRTIAGRLMTSLHDDRDDRLAAGRLRLQLRAHLATQGWSVDAITHDRDTLSNQALDRVATIAVEELAD